MIPAEKHTENKEEGSALLAVLVITLLITLLLGSVWAIYLINVKLVSRDTHNMQTRYLAEAGVYKALAHYDMDALVEMEDRAVTLFETDTAYISTAGYGAYLKLESRVEIGDRQQKVEVLVGQEADNVFKQAVLLGDPRSRLSITGTTSIKGDVTVGPQGIEQQSFKGKRFSGTVEGNVLKKKEEILPTFRGDLIKRSIAELKDQMSSGAGGSSFFKGNDKSGIRRFVKGDCILNSEKIKNWELDSENILICSGKMTVKEEITLPDLSVLLAEEGIEIKNPVKGRQLLFYTPADIWVNENGSLSGQLLAGDAVTVTDNARLRYPSLIWVHHPDSDGQQVIKISGSARIDGTVVYNAEQWGEIDKLQNKILVGPTATIRGSLFNTHQTEFYGTVKGTLLTHQFYFYKSPTTYINWIKDGTVNVKQRPRSYLLPPGFSGAGRYGIIYHKN